MNTWYSCSSCKAYFPWWVGIRQRLPVQVTCDCGSLARYAVQPPESYGKDETPRNLKKVQGDTHDAND